MNEEEKEWYDERVAIMVIDGGVSEEEAMAEAMREVKNRFRRAEGGKDE